MPAIIMPGFDSGTYDPLQLPDSSDYPELAAQPAMPAASTANWFRVDYSNGFTIVPEGRDPVLPSDAQPERVPL